jgi:hypothetical protein
MLWYL